MKPAKVVAVVTADIIASQRYSAGARRRVDTKLREAFREAERRYARVIHTEMSFRVTQGDEFQWVVSDVARTFDFLTYLRSLAATGGPAPPIRFRASIGVGGIAISKRETSYEQDGIAFSRSRQGLEEMSKARGPLRWTKLIVDRSDPDAIDAVLCLADRMMQGWTTSQWEAIRWSLLGLTREQIAKKLDVAHQNVTKRLHAAGWLHFQVGAEFVRHVLDGIVHPDRGAKHRGTLHGVQGNSA